MVLEEVLKASEERFRLLAENSSDLVVLYDATGVVTYVCPAVRTHLGYEPEELVGRRADELVHPDDLADVRDAHRSALAGPGPFTATFRLRTRDGSYRCFEVVARPRRDEAGRVVEVQAAARDTTARLAAAAKLRRTEETLHQAFERAPTGMALLGPDGYLLRVNRAFCDLTGYPEERLVGTDVWALAFPGSATAGRRWLAGAADGLDTHEREERLRRADGRVVWVALRASAVRDEEGRLLHFVAQAHDVSERKADEQRLRHLALHDPLTGLANRTLLLDHLAKALATARRRSTRVAVLFCDLDGFKAVNDRCGHAEGDELLRTVARRLERVVRPNDTAARLGGDEFVVVCEDVAGPAEAEAVAVRVRAALVAPYPLRGCETEVGVSVGVAVSESPDEDPEELLRRADAAMYRAKDAARTG